MDSIVPWYHRGLLRFLANDDEKLIMNQGYAHAGDFSLITLKAMLPDDDGEYRKEVEEYLAAYKRLEDRKNKP